MPMIMTVDLASRRDSLPELHARAQADLDQRADGRDMASREHLLRRVRAEFREMPGLRLTLAQARRLLGIREDICYRILLALIDEGLLWRGPDERFALRSDN